MNRSNGSGFLSCLGAAVGNEGFDTSIDGCCDNDVSFDRSSSCLDQQSLNELYIVASTSARAFARASLLVCVACRA
jgi:hypothetical protein